MTSLTIGPRGQQRVGRGSTADCVSKCSSSMALSMAYDTDSLTHSLELIVACECSNWSEPGPTKSNNHAPIIVVCWLGHCLGRTTSQGRGQKEGVCSRVLRCPGKGRVLEQNAQAASECENTLPPIQAGRHSWRPIKGEPTESIQVGQGGNVTIWILITRSQQRPESW